MSQKTEKKVISNIAWRSADKWGSQIISLFISIVIARIIEPEAYGIVAIVNAFINIFGVFSDFGLGESLIQKKNPDSIDYSTALIANFILGIVIYIIVYSLAPLASVIYKNELLINLIRVSALSIIISSFKNIQHAYVAKNYMFKQYFFGSIIGTVGAGVLGIWMAYEGYGVWALVASGLFDVLVDTIVCWIVVKWHVTMSFSKERFKSLFGFGSKILLTNLVERLYSKMYQLVIGIYYSGEDLAFFEKGDSLADKLTSNINNSIGSVLFSTMSDVQDDKEKVKEITRNSIKLSTYVMMPILIGLFCVAKNTIIVVFTEKWLPAVIYMQIFALGNVLSPLGIINANVIKSLGRSDLYLKMQTYKRIIALLVLAITVNFGVLYVALGCFIVKIIDVIMDSYPTKKLIDYSFLEQIKDIFPNIILCVIMVISVYFVGKIELPIFFVLTIQIITGVITYLIMSFITKNKSFINLLNLLRKRNENSRN